MKVVGETLSVKVIVHLVIFIFVYPNSFLGVILLCPKSGVALTSCASYIIQGGGNDIGCGLIMI